MRFYRIKDVKGHVHNARMLSPDDISELFPNNPPKWSKGKTEAQIMVRALLQRRITEEQAADLFPIGSVRLFYRASIAAIHGQKGSLDDVPTNPRG